MTIFYTLGILNEPLGIIKINFYRPDAFHDAHQLVYSTESKQYEINQTAISFTEIAAIWKLKYQNLFVCSPIILDTDIC